MTFLLESLTNTPTVQFFWTYLFAVSVFVGFLSNSKGDTPFRCTACDYSHADCDGLLEHLKDIQWEDTFKFSSSAGRTELCALPAAEELLNKLVIAAKEFLKRPNVLMLIKQRRLLLPINLALVTFGELLIIFSTNVDLPP